MRKTEVRETWLHLDPEDGEKPLISRMWNHFKKPVKLRPTSVTVKWERSARTGLGWELRDLTVYGDRTNHAAGGSFSVHYVGWSDNAGEIPDWVIELVAASHPGA